MVLVFLVSFLGSFHPLFVHLPLGILLLGCLLQFLSTRGKYADVKHALPIIFFTGALTAVLSCISGWFLARGGEYDQAMVNRHQWLGILTALASSVQYLLYKGYSLPEKYLNMVSAAVILLITFTGHLGGTLTHGSGYLTNAFSDDEPELKQRKPIPDINEAVLYTDVVQPMLEAKCYGCHGPSKQKGKLRLDLQDLILKGGEDGKAVIGGKPDESLMIERIMLPLSNEDHMPPKEKSQLSADEIAILHWWISTGARFDAKVKDLAVTEKISPILRSLETGGSGPAAYSDIPDTTVAAPDQKTIQLLNRLKVMVLPVKMNSHFLMANFVAAEAGADSLLKLMLPLKDQLIWLKMDGTGIKDSTLKNVAQFHRLTRLQISNNPVSDTGIAYLKPLTHLQYLNITGTKVSIQGLKEIQTLGSLKQLYVYQSKVDPSDFSVLKSLFPGTTVDTGNYKLKFLATDTMIVEEPKKKKKKKA